MNSSASKPRNTALYQQSCAWQACVAQLSKAGDKWRPTGKRTMLQAAVHEIARLQDIARKHGEL